MENKEINELVKIVGLQYKKKYQYNVYIYVDVGAYVYAEV